MKHDSIDEGLHFAKKLIVGIFGITVLLIGIALLLTPGPGLLVIFVGLVILATEFVWARRFLRKFKKETKKIVRSFKK